MKDDLKPKARSAKPRKTKAKPAPEPEIPAASLEESAGDEPRAKSGIIVEAIDEPTGKAKAALKADLDAETEAHIDTFESAGGPEPEPEIAEAVQEEGEPEEEEEPEDGDEDEDLDEDEEPEEADEPEEDEDAEAGSKPVRPVKLERLQKILAQAGVASRRRAEKLIEEGRVQVNGQVVSTLGAKADAGRDHIRVDGKLLHGAERHRYFMLNKPKGFVTTVSDPEGRPTVMQFFQKMPERLYPVGRLDYLSEGLLLVTNDGELANKLTRAASGVEKTYLVKVAGQPTEEELEQLRSGVSIDRAKPGQGRVHAAPTRIRQVRQGDNPWYEVVLVEGRNRELRKMFEEIGHFVEKIRRVGYGPLVLDVEPGQLRELDQEELTALRESAQGKQRILKASELRRRISIEEESLPSVKPRPTIRSRHSETGEGRPAQPRDFRAKPFDKRRSDDRSAGAGRPGGFGPKKPFGKSFGRPAPPQKEGFGERPAQRPFRRDQEGGSFAPRPARPAWQKSERPTRFAAGSSNEDGERSSNRPRPGSGPARSGSDRPRYQSDRPRPERSASDRSSGRGFTPRPGSGPRSGSGYRPAPGGKRPFEGGSSGSGPRTGSGYRPASGGRRPFEAGSTGSSPRSSSSYRPSPGGKRPPFEGGSRPARPFTPRRDEGTGSRPPVTRNGASRGPAQRNEGEGFERKPASGWKPKTRFGGPGKPGAGGRSSSRPAARPGSRPAKSGFKSGFKPKPGAKRPSGKKRS